MSTRVVERVDDWDAQSFSDGYSGLHDLADREFSGVVRAGGAELFMTKGVVVGIRHGTIETFEDASGTRYEAPTPALPLLAIMQDRSEEVRAQYYTEETAISEVDRTLSDGGFTGFVELSENVLSGDYFLVYHRGRSMSVAYVGNSKRLIEGDEAFDQADDEVGIYEVRPVDVDAIEIPEPVEPEGKEEQADAAGGAVDESDEGDGAAAAVSGEGAKSPDDSEEPTDATAVADNGGIETATESDAGADEADSQVESAESSSAESTAATSDADDSDGEPSVAPDQAETETTAEETRVADAERSPDEEPAAAGARSTAPQESPAQTEAAAETREEPPERATTEVDAGVETPTQHDRTDEPPHTEPETGSSPQSTPSEPGVASQTESRESATSRRATPESPTDLETKAIPSLDPERTATVSRSNGSDGNRGDAPGRAGATTHRSPEQPSTQQEPGRQSTEASRSTTRDRPQQTEAAQSAEASEPDEEPAATDDEPDTDDASERVAELQSTLEDKEARIDELQRELQSAESARDEARAELATVQEERDELQREVERLQSELQRLEDELGAKMDAERRVTPQEALDGTDIFVRYHSKGESTLEKAHESGRRREDVTDNLRLEKHTQFDASAVSVGGQTYDEFLENRVEFNFVKWIVEDLLFEIQSTGHTDTLKDLYDALPKINRIELNGVVTTTDSEDNEARETFDLVFRARMGDPLLVANINESRQGATQSMMESLITAAERVGQTNEEFASAFLVTESFFEPEALETVAEATRGGLLSRDKRKSFVNLSRKRGYHLCLVEARNENFHLEVPEL